MAGEKLKETLHNASILQLLSRALGGVGGGWTHTAPGTTAPLCSPSWQSLHHQLRFDSLFYFLFLFFFLSFFFFEGIKKQKRVALGSRPSPGPT